jgi:histidinol-phosphatase (PHP family)
MPADIHMHDELSDGTSPFDEYVDRAEHIGLTEIGLSNHFIFKPVSWSMNQEMLPRYFDIIDAAKKGPIEIKSGLEVDYIREDSEKTSQLLDKWARKLDYVIGSVHDLNGWILTSSQDTWRARAVDPQQTCDQYFGLVLELAQSGMFDIVGHIDIGKRYGYFPAQYSAESYQKALDAIAKKHMCVEINTSGLRHACKEQYPARRILEACYERDIDIAFGSDAHRPSDVGYRFDEAVRLAKDVGYTSSSAFFSRKKEQVEI